VVTVSGHRLSTTEVESIVSAVPGIAEAAVISVAHELTGQALCAFAILVEGYDPPPGEVDLRVRDTVTRSLSRIARPEMVVVVPELPKTRSGKIMRRLLRDIVEGRPLGDVTTLVDETVVEIVSSCVEQAREGRRWHPGSHPDAGPA
jgi:acetyl-CoA synthetase